MALTLRPFLVEADTRALSQLRRSGTFNAPPPYRINNSKRRVGVQALFVPDTIVACEWKPAVCRQSLAANTILMLMQQVEPRHVDCGVMAIKSKRPRTIGRLLLRTRSDDVHSLVGVAESELEQCLYNTMSLLFLSSNKLRSDFVACNNSNSANC